jgi:hypothetical protein
MLFSWIGVADFILASSDVKGVLRPRSKTLSKFFHNRARTIGMRRVYRRERGGKKFSYRSALRVEKLFAQVSRQNWHSAHIEKNTMN